MNPALKDPPLGPPSHEFMSAFCDGGTPCIDCEFCGRTHFAPLDGGAWRAEDLEAMRAKAGAEPDRYIEHSDSHSVGFGWLDGRQIVYGCPCNKARNYEEFVWRHRHEIVAYLKARTVKEKQAAVETAEAVATVEL